MLISEKVRIGRIVDGTWKFLLVDFITCNSAYLLYYFVFHEQFDFPPQIPTILGTALAFFIGFNNNQAYDRWWEARKIWGSIVNGSRSWAAAVLHYLPQNETALKQVLVKRNIAFLYLLKNKLRDENSTYFEQYLSKEEASEIAKRANPINASLEAQSKDLQQLKEEQKIDGFTFQVLSNLIEGSYDDLGKSERIKNTVFPTTYNFYTKIFVWIFIISITVVTAENVGPWSILFGTLVGYIFLAIQKIGQVLLNPFKALPTGVPLDQICNTIERDSLDSLGEVNLPEKTQAVEGEYIL